MCSGHNNANAVLVVITIPVLIILNWVQSISERETQRERERERERETERQRETERDCI